MPIGILHIDEEKNIRFCFRLCLRWGRRLLRIGRILVASDGGVDAASGFVGKVCSLDLELGSIVIISEEKGG